MINNVTKHILYFFNCCSCLINGHLINWEEYLDRLEREQHYNDPKYFRCSRCNKFFKEQN